MAKSQDMGGIIKIAAIGIGGYFLYDWWTKRPATPVSTSPATGGAEPNPGFNSLDAIYQRLAKAVGSTQLTADGFNFYLAKELPAGKSAPAPETFLPVGADREATMTLANYWGVVAPKLKTDLGLSGLGAYASLYSVMRRGY